MFKFDYLQNQRTHVKFRLGKGPSVCVFKPDQRGPLFKTMTVMLSLCPDTSDPASWEKRERNGVETFWSVFQTFFQIKGGSLMRFSQPSMARVVLQGWFTGDLGWVRKRSTLLSLPLLFGWPGSIYRRESA